MRPGEVPIPARMRHLERDARGYAIPWTVFRDTSGRAHFTINDENRRQRVIREDRCPICLTKLLRGRWFVGGPASAFHAHGAYIDPPMHTECARYALQVCPYLAAPNYAKRLDDRTLAPGEPVPLLLDPTMDPQRPPLFVAVMATGQRLIREDVDYAGTPVHLVRFLKPRRPYLRVEYWRDGCRLEVSKGEAEALAEAAAARAVA